MGRNGNQSPRGDGWLTVPLPCLLIPCLYANRAPDLETIMFHWIQGETDHPFGCPSICLSIHLSALIDWTEHPQELQRETDKWTNGRINEHSPSILLQDVILSESATRKVDYHRSLPFKGQSAKMVMLHYIDSRIKRQMKKTYQWNYQWIFQSICLPIYQSIYQSIKQSIFCIYFIVFKESNITNDGE